MVFPYLEKFKKFQDQFFKKYGFDLSDGEEVKVK